MAAVGELMQKEARPAYVRFERRAVEHKKLSVEMGRFVGEDKDFALITPPGSRDVMIYEVDDWFPLLRQQVQQERIAPAWVEAYQDAYNKWKAGQEIPVSGTPIKTWPVVSPAQVQALQGLMILTVEDLAQLDDEGVRRIGMGGVDLKNKAKAWLAASADKGKVTQEVAALKAQTDAQRVEIDTLTKQVKELTDALRTSQMVQQATVQPVQTETIQASEFLDNEPMPKRKR